MASNKKLDPHTEAAYDFCDVADWVSRNRGEYAAQALVNGAVAQALKENPKAEQLFDSETQLRYKVAGAAAAALKQAAGDVIDRAIEVLRMAATRQAALEGDATIAQRIEALAAQLTGHATGRGGSLASDEKPIATTKNADAFAAAAGADRVPPVTTSAHQDGFMTAFDGARQSASGPELRDHEGARYDPVNRGWRH